MLNRETELDEFKKVDLSVIASSFGFSVEKKRTTRRTVMMSNGSDKIAISLKGQHYVFWTVGDNYRSGTAIDFIRHYVERDCSIGRVRQILRPFLSSGYIADVRQQFKGKYASEIRENRVDLEALAKRYARFLPIDKPHPYLCDTRGIPFELLKSPRLYGRVMHCPRRNSIIFPHREFFDDNGTEKIRLSGYEIVGPSLKLFSSASRKGLFVSVGMVGDDKLAFCESGIDSLSAMAVQGEQGLRVASISGMMNGQQPELVRREIERLGEGRVLSCFDNDAGGDSLTQQLLEITQSVSRNSLIFEDKRPALRGQDYNDVLLGQTARIGRPQEVPAIER